MTRIGLSVFFTLLTAGLFAEDDGFQPLFDGKTLEGWVQRGGQAMYSIEQGGVIAGHSVPNTKNSFLCTENEYGDFVLRYEFKCDDALNSGVQIRSAVNDEETVVQIKGKEKKIPKGRVHGYQVEIDPNKPDRMWTAGIYDEARRGWLFPGLRGGDPEAFTSQGKQTYKPGKWNKVRVRCKGNRIQTWLNGEPRADFEDDLTPEGFIALQIHGVGEKTDALYCRWRKLSIKPLD